jgi:hypothetical protein
MDEYIIDTLTEKEWQKHLNQWRHEYVIQVLFCLRAESVRITMGIKRRRVDEIPARESKT